MSSLKDRFSKFCEYNFSIYQSVFKSKNYRICLATDCIPLTDDIVAQISNQNPHLKSEFKNFFAVDSKTNFTSRSNTKISDCELSFLKKFIEINYPHLNNLEPRASHDYEYHFYDYFLLQGVENDSEIKNKVIYIYNQIGAIRYIDNKLLVLFLKTLSFLIQTRIVLDSVPLSKIENKNDIRPFYNIFYLFSHPNFRTLKSQDCQILKNDFISHRSLFEELLDTFETEDRLDLKQLYNNFVSFCDKISQTETGNYLIGFWE